MTKAVYNSVDKYVIQASCREPLHVGGSSDEKGEILIHPVDDLPFIQAAGICGALRGYCEKVADDETVKNLFGSSEANLESKVKVTDGKFVNDDKEGDMNKDAIQVELRPRVKIDPETGTVASSKLKGCGDTSSGQKFDMQVVAAGAKFSFEIYIYGGSERESNLILKALSAMNDGEIQLGGQKSNGCGYISIDEVKYRRFEMKNPKDRNDWKTESGLNYQKLSDLKSEDRLNVYDVEVHALTESELLVKGIAVSDFGKDAAKAENIRNGSEEYIVPGSSVKGAIRNRMKMISDYMKLEPSLITDAFGMAAEKGKGRVGNLKFLDIVVGDKTGNVNKKLRTRIHIDKFTGGVINGALFSELNISGSLTIHIQVSDRNDPDAVTGLLLLALRDLGYKMYGLGSGQNVGKGYLDIDYVKITDKKDEECCKLDAAFSVMKGEKILAKCMSALEHRIMK